MGMFSGECAICGKKIHAYETRNNTKDHHKICLNCTNLVLSGKDSSKMMWIGDHTLEEFKNAFDRVPTNSQEMSDEEKAEAIQAFKNHNAREYNSFLVDETDERCLLYSLSHESFFLFNFDEIVGYRPIEKEHEEKKKHGIARAATGGVLFGGAGALVGAVTGGKRFNYLDKLGVSLSLTHGRSAEILLIRKSTTDQGKIEDAYGKFGNLCSMLDSIVSEKSKEKHSEEEDTADQIRKLKSLVDDGILTQEEFDAKKKQLLKI